MNHVCAQNQPFLMLQRWAIPIRTSLSELNAPMPNLMDMVVLKANSVMRLNCREPPIHDQGCARHETGRVRGEEQDRAFQFLC